MSRGGAQSRKFSSRWFRMYDEVVDDPKIQTLGDKLGFFWLNCLCLASKNRGYLPAVSDIAWKLRKKEAEVSAMIAKLYERGLLEQEADTFSPHNWGERQYASDSSTERVREFRSRKKETLSETPPETPSQSLETVAGNSDETRLKRCETVPETAPEQNRTEQIQNRAEEPPIPPAPKTGADTQTPPVPARGKHRSLAQIRKDLGIRLPWFESLCAVHPAGKDGVKAGALAFEAKVTPDEAGHALAQEMYRGAKTYRDKCRADPTSKVKWLQGWINDERWRDENKLLPVVMNPAANPAALTKGQRAVLELYREQQEMGGMV